MQPLKISSQLYTGNMNLAWPSPRTGWITPTNSCDPRVGRLLCLPRRWPSEGPYLSVVKSAKGGNQTNQTHHCGHHQGNRQLPRTNPALNGHQVSVWNRQQLVPAHLLRASTLLNEGDKLMVNVSDISLVDYTKEDKTFLWSLLAIVARQMSLYRGCLLSRS